MSQYALCAGGVPPRLVEPNSTSLVAAVHVSALHLSNKEALPFEPFSKMGKTRFKMRKFGNSKVGIRVAMLRDMNQSFASEINKIATQARAVELHEMKAQRRRQLFAKARRYGMIVLGAALVAGGVCYRQKIQQTIQDKFFGPSTVGKIDNATGEKLKDIQASAKKRDAALDELTK